MEAVSGLNLPPKLAKKVGPLEMCVRKVEHLLYELALAAANPLAATSARRRRPSRSRWRRRRGTTRSEKTSTGLVVRELDVAASLDDEGGGPPMILA